MIKLETLPQKAIDMIMPRLADEQAAYYFYLSAYAWASLNGYSNIARYFMVEMHGEEYHYKDWIKYLSDWNVKITFPSIKEPVSNFASLQDILEKQYKMELDLLNKYENDAIIMFSVCQSAYQMMSAFVSTQNYAIVSVSNMINKANGYLPTDPDLRLFEANEFSEYENYY